MGHNKTLINMAKVVVEWGERSTTVYVLDGIVLLADDRDMQGYRDKPLVFMVSDLRNKSRAKVVIHNVSGEPPTKIIPYQRTHNDRG